MKEINGFLQEMVAALTEVKGLQAIVLGGSWASNTQRPDADIDVVLYYNQDTPLEVDHVRKFAQELNDFPNPEVTVLGEWGRCEISPYAWSYRTR
jgi:predicted nucleotidyltransferase